MERNIEVNGRPLGILQSVKMYQENFKYPKRVLSQSTLILATDNLKKNDI